MMTSQLQVYFALKSIIFSSSVYKIGFENELKVGLIHKLFKIRSNNIRFVFILNAILILTYKIF